MVEVTRSASVSFLGREFDDFLFAPIGDGRNDMPLRVLSALARLDVAPWQDAAQLARLPGKTAIQRLATLIAALPDGPSAHPDPGAIAVRLIARLPRRARFNIPSHETLLGVGAETASRAAMCVIFMALVVVLGAQCIIAIRHPPAQIDNVRAPATSTVFPQMPPQSSGQ